MNDKKITAPFTADQVDRLNDYQTSGALAPFTCKKCNDNLPDQPLLATPNGWVCMVCGYKQDWAWEFMADPDNFPTLPW